MKQPGDPLSAFFTFFYRVIGNALKLFKLVPALQAPVFVNWQLISILLPHGCALKAADGGIRRSGIWLMEPN
jgi:hypothetical protein